jgi:hypothetical protein
VLTRFVEPERRPLQWDGSGPERAGGCFRGGRQLHRAGSIFGLFVLGILGVIVFAVIRSRRESARRLAQVRAAIDEDITEFGERVRAWIAAIPKLSQESRDDMGEALDAYERAKSAGCSHAIPGGRRRRSPQPWRTAVVRVDVHGGSPGRRGPAERRPPCFDVDPRAWA